MKLLLLVFVLNVVTALAVQDYRPLKHRLESSFLDHKIHGGHEYDEGGLNRHEHLRDDQGESSYGSDDEYDQHGHKQHSQYDIGQHGSHSAKGGQEGHDKKYHDRGYYVREKKYGYEKAYGYDKEAKKHDKGGNAHSYGNHYNHHGQHAQHKQGSQGQLSHALREKKHRHGAQNQAHHGRLLDLSKYYKQGQNQQNLYDNRLHKLVKDDQEYVTVPQHRYIGNLHGLGGLRVFDNDGLNQGYRGLKPRVKQYSYVRNEPNYSNKEYRQVYVNYDSRNDDRAFDGDNYQREPLYISDIIGNQQSYIPY